MQGEELDSVHYDSCAQCAGIWFDQGELGKARASTIDTLTAMESNEVASMGTPKEKSSIRACPNDLFTLHTYDYAADPIVQLDHCPECGGVWVEESELGKMDEAIRKKTFPSGASSEARQEIGIMEAISEGTVDRQERIANAWRFLGQRHLWPGL